MKTLLDFYEDPAQSREEGYGDEATQPVLKRFAQSATVLDIGCGVGEKAAGVDFQSEGDRHCPPPASCILTREISEMPRR